MGSQVPGPADRYVPSEGLRLRFALSELATAVRLHEDWTERYGAVRGLRIELKEALQRADAVLAATTRRSS